MTDQQLFSSYRAHPQLKHLLILSCISIAGLSCERNRCLDVGLPCRLKMNYIPFLTAKNMVIKRCLNREMGNAGSLRMRSVSLEVRYQSGVLIAGISR